MKLHLYWVLNKSLPSREDKREEEKQGRDNDILRGW